MIIQGREIISKDIEFIRQLIQSNPSWTRTRLSEELCILWNWRAATGQIKDMACRTLLYKLEQRGYLTLPPSRRANNRTTPPRTVPYVHHKTTPIFGSLNTVAPIHIEVVVGGTPQSNLFKYLLDRYHYLGWSGTVGENMKYLVSDRYGNPLACLLFGSAAWSSAPRDEFIGWDADTRKANLQLLTNNMRFLIARRISSDWMDRYNHPIYLLETFVDRQRFRGTCYRAANWIYVGKTTGRTRNNRDWTIRVPVKDIYLYPLIRGFREALNP